MQCHQLMPPFITLSAVHRMGLLHRTTLGGVESAVPYTPHSTGGAMASEPRSADTKGNYRRTFLKRVALGLAAIGAYAALAKRPFGGSKRDGRSMPADLPGSGSIFQPRGDRRSGR